MRCSFHYILALRPGDLELLLNLRFLTVLERRSLQSLSNRYNLVNLVAHGRYGVKGVLPLGSIELATKFLQHTTYTILYSRSNRVTFG